MNYSMLFNQNDTDMAGFAFGLNSRAETYGDESDKKNTRTVCRAE